MDDTPPDAVIAATAPDFSALDCPKLIYTCRPGYFTQFLSLRYRLIFPSAGITRAVFPQWRDASGAVICDLISRGNYSFASLNTFIGFVSHSLGAQGDEIAAIAFSAMPATETFVYSATLPTAWLPSEAQLYFVAEDAALGLDQVSGLTLSIRQKPYETGDGTVILPNPPPPLFGSPVG